MNKQLFDKVSHVAWADELMHWEFDKMLHDTYEASRGFGGDTEEVVVTVRQLGTLLKFFPKELIK